MLFRLKNTAKATYNSTLAVIYYVSYGHLCPQSCMMHNDQELFGWETDYYFKPTILDYQQRVQIP